MVIARSTNSPPSAGQESMLGIFAQNCPQWHMTMQACVQNRQVSINYN